MEITAKEKTFIDILKMRDYQVIELIEDTIDLVQNNQLLVILKNNLFTLTEREIRVFGLYYLIGLDYKELAIMHQCTTERIRQIVRSAIKKLKRSLIRTDGLFNEMLRETFRY